MLLYDTTADGKGETLRLRIDACILCVALVCRDVAVVG
jgi:hypothetical protein